MSKNKCKDCDKNDFTNWTSGNGKIDNFIQEMQLEINKCNDDNIVFEWIPYNQFNDIEEIDEDDFSKVYSAIWKDGPLRHNKELKRLMKRSEPDKKVVLECLYNLQNISEFLNEVKTYSNYNKIYGISQNPDTKDCIIVLKDVYCKKCGEKYADVYDKWCKSCLINLRCQTSGNETIDDFIQEMQLKIKYSSDIVFEWIPYNQFNDVKEISKNDFSIIYSAIWKDGQLCYNWHENKYTRNSDKKINLKCLYNLQNINEFLNEVKTYSNYDEIYGISQNPDTKNYIMVLNDEYCEKCGEKYTDTYERSCKPCKINHLKSQTSGTEKIDNFIQEMQSSYWNTIFEWIPYDQFIDIKEISNGTLYTAMWKDGPLVYNLDKKEYIRISNEEVSFKYLYNYSQNINEFLNEVKNKYLKDKTYGISQNPNTKDYIVVLEDDYCENCGEKYTVKRYKWCKPCKINYLKNNFTNWTSGNRKIDNFIQKMQLEINKRDDIVFEWIPYNQFNDIKELGKGDLTTVYTAIWKNGPMDHNHCMDKEYKRNSNIKVVLKCLSNSQTINEFLNEVKNVKDLKDKLYGISQNSNTKDYIVVLEDDYCENCGEKYTVKGYKWCKPCKINYLKNNFTNWTSGNKKIDDFIQEMQLKIDKYDDIVFKWVQYNQFNDIKVGKDDYATAIWKDREVALKCLYNSQNTITNEFLNEIKNKHSKDKIYGISQNPDTKDYIMIIEDAYCKKCGGKYANISEKWCKLCQINYLKSNFMMTSGNKIIDDLIREMQLKINKYNNVVFEWIPYNQFDDIKKIGEGGFATVYLATWKDGPLSYGYNKKYTRRLTTVALKCLNNSQNATNVLNEIKAYSINNYNSDYIINIYGISQNPDTKGYVLVLGYERGGNFDDWTNNNYKEFDWYSKLLALGFIIRGLKNIHKKQMIHRDFHTGNILANSRSIRSILSISDMGLCGEVGNIDETKIYGVMPYVAPEVLRGKPYTKAADIYSFGMIMYFVATGKQPFANCAHDHLLVLDICEKRIRPEINEPEAPKCYIDLMKRCWDSNTDNRPNVIEVEESITLFLDSYVYQKNWEIEKQFIEAERYRNPSFLPIRRDNQSISRDNQSSTSINNQSATHSQAIYTSRLLNPFTKNLSECLDCEISK